MCTCPSLIALEPNSRISSLFPPSFRLDYTVTLTKHTLDTHLKIANTSVESFRFNTALHTCLAQIHPHGLRHARPTPGLTLSSHLDPPHTDYAVPSSERATLTPIDSIPFTSRLDPSSPHDLTAPVPPLAGKHLARCYHADTSSNANTTFLQYDSADENKEGVEIVSTGGWRDFILWNPGEEVKMPDLEEGGWKHFVCWEPGCIQELSVLEAGGVWEGTQLCEAK